MWNADAMMQSCTCDAPTRTNANLGKSPHADGCPSQGCGDPLGTKEMNPSNKNVKKDVALEDSSTGWPAAVEVTSKTKAISQEKEVRDFGPGTKYPRGRVRSRQPLRPGGSSLARRSRSSSRPTKKISVGGGHN